MRVSLSWLNQLVQVDEGVEDLAERLSMAGFEVEEIDDLRVKAQGVVVGHVQRCEKHPNADKLSVCQVDVGSDQPLQIVCGAPNVRAELPVPVAMVGAVLPAVGLTIKAGELRGVTSEGMICQRARSRERSGWHCRAGSPRGCRSKRERLWRPCWDWMTPFWIWRSRPTAPMGCPWWGLHGGGCAHGSPARCPHRASALVSGFDRDRECCEFQRVALQPHLDRGCGWLPPVGEPQQRLERAGINSVNAIAITNHVMVDRATPHAFDADALEELTENPCCRQLWTAPGTPGRTVHGSRRSGSDPGCACAGGHPSRPADCPRRCDGKQDSGVSASTKRIWLESAMFSPAAVRATHDPWDCAPMRAVVLRRVFRSISPSPVRSERSRCCPSCSIWWSAGAGQW